MNEETTVVAIQGEMNTGYTKEGKIVGGGGQISCIRNTYSETKPNSVKECFVHLDVTIVEIMIVGRQPNTDNSCTPEVGGVKILLPTSFLE